MANLSKESKIHLEAFSQLPALETMDPQAVRDMLNQAPPVEVELAPLANIEDKVIPVDGGEINIRIYTPEGIGPFPIFVYYHGGGWVLGDIATSDASCRMIANKTRHIVVSVDYRLAPEYKYPTPINDSYAALKWISENAAAINGIASNIVVGGDSAGGNIAAAMSLKSREQNGPPISAQVLIYPVTDMKFDTKSYQDFEKGFGLDKNLMVWFVDHYIASENDKQDMYAAPLIADDLNNLPPAYVIVAENDVLRDEGLAYAKRLKEAGVNVETIIEEGLVHGYFTTMAIFPDRIKRSINNITQFLNETNKQVESL
ncbi:alpha/beta hydrolase [Virgibacillus sp. W0181]|uniref:alpha/beta hydrolase n=1 Tax=Virgibacillus sp. W0181 TaxID=3391581 RepID=UPI003F48B61D